MKPCKRDGHGVGDTAETGPTGKSVDAALPGAADARPQLPGKYHVHHPFHCVHSPGAGFGDRSAAPQDAVLLNGYVLLLFCLICR